MHAPTHTIADRQDAAAAMRQPSTTREGQPARPARERALPQLTLRGIIAVWAAAALPMGLLSWVVAPRARRPAERPRRAEPCAHRHAGRRAGLAVRARDGPGPA